MPWFGPKNPSPYGGTDCGCCGLVCPPTDCYDGNQFLITGYTFTVSLPDTIVFWFRLGPWPAMGGTSYRRSTTTGWSAFNGTYIATLDLETCAFNIPTAQHLISWEIESITSNNFVGGDGCPTGDVVPGSLQAGSQLVSGGPSWQFFGFPYPVWGASLTNHPSYPNPPNNPFRPAINLRGDQPVCYAQPASWNTQIWYENAAGNAEIPGLECPLTFPGYSATGYYEPTTIPL